MDFDDVPARVPPPAMLGARFSIFVASIGVLQCGATNRRVFPLAVAARQQPGQPDADLGGPPVRETFVCS